MAIPGFTAEKSLHKMRKHYPILSPVSDTPGVGIQLPGQVYPAIPPRGVDTHQCYLDCIDLNSCTDKTGVNKRDCLNACRKKCKDPGVAGPIVPRKCIREDYLFKYLCDGAKEACFALAGECGFFYPLCAIPCYQYRCELNCTP
jgi:hypothetical protein